MKKKKNQCQYGYFYIDGEKICQNELQDYVEVMLEIVTTSHWLYPVILAGQMLLLVLFWICTALTKNNDFTKHYLNSAIVPMTLSVLVKIVSFLAKTLKIYEIANSDVLQELDVYFTTSYHYIFSVNTVIFMIMTLWTANKRRAIKKHLVWLPYYIVYAILAVMSIFTFMRNNYQIYELAMVVFTSLAGCVSVAATIITLVMCCACCCCSKSKPDQDWSDPVIYNARSRMGWLIVFLFFLPATTSIDLLYDNNLSYETHVVLIFWELLSPYYILIPVFLFLPTYRSALFCCCENNTKSAHPNGGKIIPVANGPIGALNANNGQTQNAAPNNVGQSENGPNPSGIDRTKDQNADTQAQQNSNPVRPYPVQQNIAPQNQTMEPGTQNMAQMGQMGQYPMGQYMPNGQPTYPNYPSQFQQNMQQYPPQHFMQHQNCGVGNMPSAPFEASDGNAPSLNQENLTAQHAQMAPMAPHQQGIMNSEMTNQQMGYGFSMGHQNQQYYPMQEQQNGMSRYASQPNLTVIAPPAMILQHSNSYANISTQQAQSPHFVA